MRNFGLPGHEGVDWAGKLGDPIYAVSDGIIKLIASDNGIHPYGNHLRLIHQHGADVYESVYAHLSGFVVGLAQGDRVRAGQQIGYMGSSGNSTGVHLHLTLKRNGKIVDPELYL